jgi:hypothetical protein
MIKYLFAVCLLVACNTPKRLAKQADAINRLTDKVNAAKVIQIKDSTVYKPGDVVSVTDTFMIIDSVMKPGVIVEKYYFNKYSATHDTLKIFSRDAVHESALQNELIRAQSKLEPLQDRLKDQIKMVKRLSTWLLVAVFALGGLLFTQIKNPLSWIIKK